MVVVVKVGGSILGEGIDPSVLDDIGAVAAKKQLILVHGGGRAVTETAKRLGKEQRFIVSPGGIRSRYTDLETIKIYTMVMTGAVNKDIVTALQKIGLPAVGISGVDGALIKADRKKKLLVVDERGRKRAIDGGYTGKISSVNGNLLKTLLSEKYLPVVSPVALSEEFEYLNVDGDRAAAYVAGGVKADSVIFLTDVKGVLMEGELVKKLTSKEAEALRPKIGFGMEKKVLASLEALSMGVKESIIASGLVKNPVASALAHRNCTVISDE
ncbi:MAG: [LysW]-aminoadipate/[LysW]-glutamate kinase [Thaumarchaeota archaeon]|nr:[LysW]-aminoadipate/[LysW]-glutamate kinase [Nitrososphaerota archaeon]